MFRNTFIFRGVFDKRREFDINTPGKNTSDLIRFGTSSFSSKDWIGNFYPEGTEPSDFLRYYSEKYDTVEVDATYYKIPTRSMTESWNLKTPEGFLFSAKFPRSIVHAGEKAAPDVDKIMEKEHTYYDRDKFLESMSLLGNKLGYLLIQFPYFNKKLFGSRKPFMEKLDRFLGDLPNDFRYAVEIRNRNWLKPEFAGICRQHNAAVTLVDHAWMPHGDEMESYFDPITTDFTYIRLLGNRKEIEQITKKWDKIVIDRDDRLKRWADFIAGLIDREIFGVVYANNHYAGNGPMTLERLRELYMGQN
ncbi:MAG: DUF72 domain-containing protein [candidate division Zixibacteria bacterium]|nr:DUF72 domain-containing protein [candidate division Zixibacteria bacterium]